MAEGVVVGLEAIEVEERHGAAVRSFAEHRFEIGHRLAAVAEPGQAVGLGDLGELALALPHLVPDPSFSRQAPMPAAPAIATNMAWMPAQSQGLAQASGRSKTSSGSIVPSTPWWTRT